MMIFAKSSKYRNFANATLPSLLNESDVEAYLLEDLVPVSTRLGRRGEERGRLCAGWGRRTAAATHRGRGDGLLLLEEKNTSIII